jgi:hypothetical protein
LSRLRITEDLGAYDSSSGRGLIQNSGWQGDRGQQLGRLGNRLGDYTDRITLRPFARAGDRRKEIYLTEIKSRLRQDGIDQILDTCASSLEHRGKKLFGILAACRVASRECAVACRPRQETLRVGVRARFQDNEPARFSRRRNDRVDETPSVSRRRDDRVDEAPSAHRRRDDRVERRFANARRRVDHVEHRYAFARQLFLR